MVITKTVLKTIIASLEPRTVTEVTDLPTHKIIELSRRELAKIAASIKTMYVAFSEGAKYGFLSSNYDRVRLFQMSDHTWKYMLIHRTRKTTKLRPQDIQETF